MCRKIPVAPHECPRASFGQKAHTSERKVSILKDDVLDRMLSASPAPKI
jgi:hypothetical protein